MRITAMQLQSLQNLLFSHLQQGASATVSLRAVLAAYDALVANETMGAELPRTVVDWIKPDLFAKLIGATPKAMDRKRETGRWPAGLVWDKVGGEVLYSLSGYNEWVNQNRLYLQASSLMASSSVSISDSETSATKSLGPSRRRRRVSAPTDVFVLK